MFKGRLGIWIFVLLLAIGGPWLYEHIPVWLHTDTVIVASELTNVDMLDAMSSERYGKFKVNTTTETPDIIFSTDNTPRDGYELVENAVISPLVLYVVNDVDDYENGFIQDDSNGYYLRINLHHILTAIEDGSTWQDIGINRKVLEGKVTLNIPDENDWCYPAVVELFYITLNGNQAVTEEQRTALQPRVDKLLSKCVKCPQIAQSISDEAADHSDGYKAFLAPEYLYMTCEGMGVNQSYDFVPVYLTKTTYISANAYLKTGYTDVDLSHGLFEAMKTSAAFMEDTGWRPRDVKFDVTGKWSRCPNVA